MAPSRESFFKKWFSIGLFSVLWLDLFRLLSSNWATREQYAYGWFIPFFIIYFVWRRSMDRPDPAAGSTGRVGFLTRSVVLLAAISLLPMRIIYEVNRDWPLISWPYTTTVVLLTLFALGLFQAEGGDDQNQWRFCSAWPKHFGFPICLVWLALLWPGVIENAVTQNLMRLVTSATVEVVDWFGVPAVQQGNVIQLSVGSVGVDEACSGVRSLHASLMVGVVMGELYRLRVMPRIGLVLAGLILAFAFNVMRTTWLTLQTAKEGMSSLAKWHDPAGWTTTAACFLAVWIIATLLRKRFASLQLDGATSRVEAVEASSSVALRICRSYLLAVGVWAVVVFGLTEMWYRSHDKSHDDFARWTVALSESAPGFRTVDLPERTRELLGYDAGLSAKWQNGDGADWTVYFFQWDGKTAESIMRARSHRPEICLPATGIKQATDIQEDYFEVPPLKLPFQHASYSAGGEMLYVFYCLWQDGDETRTGMRTRGRADRLRGPLAGQRRFGQQVLEIITSGYPSASMAERAVRGHLAELVRIKTPPERPVSSMVSNLQNHAVPGANYGVH